ncbi:MAG: 6-pyruvoyl trahydropterin synthase family protein [Candidatus Baldrarchaeia archaeon]
MYGLKVGGLKIKFSSAHFLVGHPKCGRLHGHNWLVTVEFKGEIGEDGMIIDFLDVKNYLKKVIEPLDHKLLIPIQSPNVSVKVKDDRVELEQGGKRYSLPKEDVSLLPLKAITCETLAKYIHDKIKNKYGKLLIRVYVSEDIGVEASYFQSPSFQSPSDQ